MRKDMATALLALVAASATVTGASAEPGIITTANYFNWSGFYAGVNAGGAINNTCANWTPYNGGVRVQDYVNNSCPNNNAFTGGAQLGFNFIIAPFMLGLEADYNGWSSKSHNRIVNYTGTSIPMGTYNLSGKESPNGGGTVRARFGYVANQWMPYVTAGFAYASGSPSTTISYTAPGATTPDATLNATRTLSSNGWTAGLGVEYGVMSNLSVKAEWLYWQLGHGSRQPGICTSSGSAAGNAFCTAFQQQFNFSSHNSAEINVFRLGVNYLFNGP